MNGRISNKTDTSLSTSANLLNELSSLSLGDNDDDFENIDQDPDLSETAYLLESEDRHHLPATAVSLDDFQRVDEEITKSAHDVYKAINNKDGQYYYVKMHEPSAAQAPQEQPQTGYTSPIEAIVEAEAALSAVFHYLAPDVFPITIPCYNKKGRLVAVASKAAPGFVANKKKPLKKQDFEIELLISEARRQLEKSIDNLISCLNRDPDAKSGLLELGVQHARNFFNWYYSNSAISTKATLENFQKAANFSKEAVSPLLACLEGRKKHVLSLNQPSKYDDELKFLNDAINTAQALVNNQTVITPAGLQRVIRTLEEFDEVIKLQGTKVKPDESLTATFIRDNEPVTETINSNDLIHYRILRGLSALVDEWIKGNDDPHNQNIGQYDDGIAMIDRDMAEWKRITSHIKVMGFIDRSWRKPAENAFRKTPSEAKKFPNIVNTPYHWPTKTTYVGQSVVNLISVFYDISKNLFTPEDNELIKTLPTYLIFEFSKYLRMMEYVLTPQEVYKNINLLNTRADTTFLHNDGKIKNLRSELSACDFINSEELTATLIKTDDFQTYMENHGKYALERIQKAAMLKKQKLAPLVETHPLYKELYDAINPDEITKNYKRLSDLTFLAKKNPKLSYPELVKLLDELELRKACTFIAQDCRNANGFFRMIPKEVQRVIAGLTVQNLSSDEKNNIINKFI